MNLQTEYLTRLAADWYQMPSGVTEAIAKITAKPSYAKFFQQIAFICFLGSLGQHPSLGLLEW